MTDVRSANLGQKPLARALAEYVGNVDYSRLAEPVRACARKTLMNSVATTIGAAQLPDVVRALAYAREEGATGQSTVLVHGDQLPTLTSVFVNGVMANALGQEETHLQSGTHPAETTVPAILALGERLASSGQEILTALVAGVEVTTALAHMQLTPPVKYDSCEAPAVYGTIGAAAGAAKLLKLDQSRTTSAITLAANLAAGLSECIKVGTEEYHFSVGASPMHGYLAASLASRGADAAVTSLEGPGGFYHLFASVTLEQLQDYGVVGDVMGRLGSCWSLEELIFKPYPVNYFNQVYIDGARLLREKHKLAAEDIGHITIEVGQLAALSGAMVEPPFAVRQGVLGSTPFCVACMIARGHVTLEDTLDLEAKDILELVKRTTVVPREALVSVAIEIDTTRGKFHFDGNVDGRDYRLTEEEIRKIAVLAMEPVIGARARPVADALAQIESCEDIGTVIRLTLRERRSDSSHEDD